VSDEVQPAFPAAEDEAAHAEIPFGVLPEMSFVLGLSWLGCDHEGRPELVSKPDEDLTALQGYGLKVWRDYSEKLCLFLAVVRQAERLGSSASAFGVCATCSVFDGSI